MKIYTIKSLEWKKISPGVFVAITMFGVYTASHIIDIIQWVTPEYLNKYVASLDMAKSAAQDDFEERIKKGLNEVK